ncbi:MAG: hypothetical protein PHI27_09650 [Eubacteriales bacterium]|nr:hypothetical protein [Eubacteriales bacterium]MDD3882506.1 hypothetical protein [Eubacteriales bacterium]MDD4512806.1 hypothetical protein [Eubacteriales bacterium]
MEREIIEYSGNVVHGRATQTDLMNLRPFLLPRCSLKGSEFPQFSPDLCRMSLEMAACSYDFEIEDFLRAGWGDVSIQVEKEVYSDIDSHSMRETLPYIQSVWNMYRAKQKNNTISPITQIRRAQEQMSTTDSGKVVVMARSLPESGGSSSHKYVISIGFKGTGLSFADWVSNLKFADDKGLHKGFRELAIQLLDNSEKIDFPRIAAEEGMESLTLQQVVGECAKEDSRFILWLTGHSQGGAVMQAFAYELIERFSVLPKNILGYAFASPTVATKGLRADPLKYPLFHIINTDDYVPRVGASWHLGITMQFQPNQEFRDKNYHFRTGDTQDYARREIYDLLTRVRDMKTAAESMYALLSLLSALDSASLMGILAKSRFVRAVGSKAISTFMQNMVKLAPQDLIRLCMRAISRDYKSIAGHEINDSQLTPVVKPIEDAFARVGMHEGMSALLELGYAPHSLYVQGEQSPYTSIVTRYMPMLRAGLWAVQNEGGEMMTAHLMLPQGAVSIAPLYLHSGPEEDEDMRRRREQQQKNSEKHEKQ